MQSVDLFEMEQAFKASLAFLEDAGFIFDASAALWSSALGGHATLSWSNATAQRTLCVTYFERPLHGAAAKLLVKIVNLRPPVVDPDDYGAMNSINVPVPALDSLEGEGAQRFQIYSELIRREVAGPLWRILSGMEWKEVRFDWGNLK